MRYLFFLIFIFFFINHSLAQTENAIFTLKEFYTQILAYHPIVKQANLLNEVAKQELRMARGGFDPKIEFDLNRKDFDKKNYYTLIQSKFKIPTWIGELNMGYDRNTGVFLDESDFTDESGQTSIGISIPLGKNLLIDSRRAVLRQAKYFQTIADAEKIKTINKILFNAAKEYWQWYFHQQSLRLLQEGTRLAQERYDAVKQRVILGELAAIDSVQAKITLQERLVQLRQAEVDVTNSRLMVGTYLWSENDTPLILADNIVPESFNPKIIDDRYLQNAVAYAQENHPEIRKVRFKLLQLNVEERLQANNLLPTINLNYNVLRDFQPANETTQFNFPNNYKLGVQFEFPIFLRKERSKLQQVRIKQSQTNFELIQTNRDIQNAIQSVYNELRNLEIQIDLQQDMVNNYILLRDGELRRFINGESSLFLVNTQETKLIEAQIKLESQKSKYEKTRAELIWASGGQVWE